MNLRDFLSILDKDNELIRIKKEVSTNYEIASIMYSLKEKPVIFEDVKGFDFQIFSGITSNRDVIAKGLGTTKDKLLFKLELLDNIVPKLEKNYARV